MLPLISILIPVYNVEKYIEKCLTSLFSNKHAKDCEFVIVDDCSTDKSLEIAQNVIEKYSKTNNTKIIKHTSNKGIASTRNTGLKNSSGIYILNVDSDDYVEENFIDSFYNLVLKDDYDLVSCGYFCDSEWNSITCSQKILKETDKLITNLLNDKSKAFLWCKLFRRDIIESYDIYFIDGIDMLEDFMFCIKYFPYVSKIFIIEDYLYHYVQRNNSYVHQLYTEKKVLNIINALDFCEESLKNTYGHQYFDEHFRESMYLRKLIMKFHCLIEGSLYNQKKYFRIWPEAFPFIDKTGFGKVTKRLLKKCSTSKNFPAFLFFINSVLLIRRGSLSFTQYFLKN